MNENAVNTPRGGQGYVIVRAGTALGAIPVEGATITIRQGAAGENNGERGGILYVLTTDRDGKTPPVALDAPPRSNSMTPGSAPAFATYNIDVEALGFYHLFFHQVPVYDGVTSLQSAILIPIAQNGNSDGVSSDEDHFEGNVNPNLRTPPTE